MAPYIATLRAVSFSIFFVSCTCLHAQEEAPPTLSMGLNKLVFGKGMIDVDLLSEMVAERQEKLAKESVRRVILNRVDDESFALSNYAFNVLDMVLFEKNKAVIKNDLMEYSANLALAYGFAELMTQLGLAEIDRGVKRDSTAILRLAMSGYFDTKFKERYRRADRPNEVLLLTTLKPAKKDQVDRCLFRTEVIPRPNLAEVMVDMVYDICRNNFSVQAKGFFLQPVSMSEEQYRGQNKYLVALADLDSLITLSKSSRGVKADTAEYQRLKELLTTIRADHKATIELLFDKYDMIRESGFLLLRDTEHLLESYYEGLESEFRLLKKPDVQELEQRKAWQGELAAMRKAAENEGDALRKGIDSTKTLLEQRYNVKGWSTLADSLVLAALDTVPNPADTIGGLADHMRMLMDLLTENVRIKAMISVLFDEAAKEVSQAERRVSQWPEQLAATSEAYLKHVDFFAKWALHTLRDANTRIRNPQDRADFNALYKNITYILDPKSDFHRVDYARYLSDSLVYLALRLASDSTNKDLAGVARNIERIELAIRMHEVLEFKGRLDSTSLKTLHLGKEGIDPRRFIEFIRRLNQLDKAETYDYLFKVLNDAGNIISDNGNARAMNLLVNNLKRYTVIEPDSDRLNVDVEGVITDLYEHYAEGNNAWIAPILDIGINQGVFIGPNKFMLNDTTRLQNLSFASEKIGVKVKLLNWRRRYSTIPGEKRPWAHNAAGSRGAKARKYVYEPLVSDLHIGLYGSGLLYNIVDTKTSNDFTSPLGGALIGLTFFNGFDLNAGVAHAFVPERKVSTDGLMFTFGFDLRLTDYIKQAQLRRKAKLAAQEKAEQN